MTAMDYEYLASLVRRTQSGDSNAFAELYTATHEKLYHFAFQYVENAYLAQNILQDVYTFALKNIHSLHNPHLFTPWLNQISFRSCYDLRQELIQKGSIQPLPLPQAPSIRKAPPAPLLDAQTSNQLLNNVFAACGMSPNVIPVELLGSWGNYRHSKFLPGKVISCAFLLILVLLPLMFLKPSIIAERTNVESSSNAEYHIKVRALFPIRAISASLDGAPLALRQTGPKEYSVEITENGTLELNTESLNGQKTSKTYTVSYLDTQKPSFLDYYSKDGLVYLTVQDTYSGIDYDGISGMAPESYDMEKGLIVFKIPESAVTVVIPDNAGNELSLSFSPTTADSNS